MKKFRNIFNKKKVLITGHTGFKGSWLSLWMCLLGANVLGISKNFVTKPSHAKFLNFNENIDQHFFDIQNQKKLKKIINSFKPDFIFHLAAQALVHQSYKEPFETWKTNTFGTLNLLECLKNIKKNCVAIIITSDKCYKNLEIKRGYNENDKLGGDDPYSASKAAADIAIQSYIKSYFSSKKTKVRIGIARAGNVIGGGDWSENRLIPDCIKSWSKNKVATLRSPNSTRPWQHVLEALSGYLFFASHLKIKSSLHGEIFNFGPAKQNNYRIIEVVKLMEKKWKNVKWIIKQKKNRLKESKLLKLNSSKANNILKWENKLSFQETISLVISWYIEFYSNKKGIKLFSENQIREYEKKLSKF